MSDTEDKKVAKKIIKQRKANKNLWTKEDVLYAKLVRKRIKEIQKQDKKV
tara:strand:+ start:717 stop:866 length:150 start_codon:yes stop_codon:yes gene_type:complete